MKKFLLILFSSLVLLALAACTDANEQEPENQQGEETDSETVEDQGAAEEASAEENDAGSTQGATDDESVDEGPQGNTDLTLQLTKVDEESGATLESDIYMEIAQLMEEHPDMGTENDFSVFTVDIYQTEAGRSLVLLGINRTPLELTNISFELNLGSSEEFILESQPVHLTEEEMGVFPVDGVMPFVIDISDEQAEALININQADILLTIENFEFEEAK
jgi:hypothetical protein